MIDTSGTDAVPRLSLGSEFCWDEEFTLPTESEDQRADSDSSDESDDGGDTKKVRNFMLQSEVDLCFRARLGYIYTYKFFYPLIDCCRRNREERVRRRYCCSRRRREGCRR